MKTLLRCTPLLLLLATLSGCAATTASLETWEANELPLAGRRETAVLTFEGNPDAANPARSTVVEGIQKTGFHRLSSPQRVAQITTRGGSMEAGAAPLSVREVIEQARRAGVDAVIAARVDTKNEGSGAAVMLRYQVIDTGTGKIINQDKIVRRNEKATSADDTTALKALAVECGEAMVAKISAHVRVTEVELASMTYGAGAAQVAAGNTYAVKGDWDNAAKQYNAALEIDKKNHAAMYNLALAHQSRHDYKTAAKYFASAREISNTALYQKAEENLQQASTTYDLVQTRLAQPALQPNIPVAPNTPLSQQQIAASNRNPQPAPGQPATGQPAPGQQPPSGAQPDYRANAFGQGSNVQQAATQQQLPNGYQQFAEQYAGHQSQQPSSAAPAQQPAGGFNRSPQNSYGQQPNNQQPPNAYVQRRYTEPLNHPAYSQPGSNANAGNYSQAPPTAGQQANGYSTARNQRFQQPPISGPANPGGAYAGGNNAGGLDNNNQYGAYQAYQNQAYQNQAYQNAPGYTAPGNSRPGSAGGNLAAGGNGVIAGRSTFTPPAYQRPGQPIADSKTPAPSAGKPGGYDPGGYNPGGYGQENRVTRFPETGSPAY